VTAARVLLLRHGRTDHNSSGRWQGQLDTQLDAVGLAQAESVAEVLAEVVARRRAAGEPVRLATSDLSRARDTAAAIEQRTGVTARPDVRLREIDGGSWQGLTREQIVAAGMAEDLDRWRRGEDVRVGGSERRSEAGARCAEAVAELAAAQDGGLLVVVAHGGALRGATLSLLGMPAGQWRVLGAMGNCHWVVLQPAEPTWALLAYNVGQDAVAGL
jgi:probable phosphoglycerate mutase